MPRKSASTKSEKAGWRRDTVKRDELTLFLDRLTDNLHVPMLHIHLVPGCSFNPARGIQVDDIVDVFYYYNPKGFG